VALPNSMPLLYTKKIYDNKESEINDRRVSNFVVVNINLDDISQELSDGRCSAKICVYIIR